MMTQATTQREIRVFLSSTFRDMDAERHYLVTRVFPEIRQICYQRMINFSEIDLRWGITEEAAHNGRTVQICLEEIERCRSLGIPPFFIGFLGERYGWVPQADDLAAYWQQSPDQRYAGLIRDALEENISVTELEIRFAFLAPPPDVAPISPASTPRVQMFLRDPALTATMASANAPQDVWFDRLPDGTPDSTRTAQLASLKQRLRQHFPQTIAIDGYDSVEQFGEAVRAYLLSAIDTLYPAEKMPNRWQQRTHEHAQFAAVRRRAYVPLTAFRQQIVSELNQGWMAISPEPWLITAPSGMGKSAFLADLESTLREKNRQAPMPWDDDYVPLEISELLSQDDNYRVFSHYIGADGDTTLDNWRNRLFWFLAEEGDSTEPASDDHHAWQQVMERVQRFRQRENATLVLILDAINQFDKPELAIHSLQQLEWPSRVLLVLSATPEVQSFLEQQKITWKCRSLPALTQEEREALCQASLSLVSKSLSGELTGQLISAPACDNPLFMRLVLEELCLHARHEALPERLTTLLACAGPGALFTSVLAASDRDFSSKLATRAACAIAASRRGLTHGELSRILAIYPSLKVPDSELVPLLARLAPYCQNSDGRLRLLHNTLYQALQDNDEMESCRERILGEIQDSSGFALAERTWQWLSLGEIDPVIRELSEVMAVIRLHEVDPALLHTVWQFSGIYDGRRLDPRFEQTFAWTAPDPAVLQNHLPAALSIFTWLRQSRAEKAATRWAEMIKPAVEDDKTPPGLKAHFYNTLTVLAQKTANPALAKEAMDQVLENLFNPGEAGMKMLAVTMSNMAQQLNAAGKSEQALELYQKAKVAALQPPRDPAVLANIIMQIAQIKAQSGNTAETEQHLQEAVALIEQMPPTPQRKIMLSSFYQELATVYLVEKNFARAVGLYDRAIAAVETIYSSDATEIRKLEESRDLFYRLAGEHGQTE
ncbi:uncharacterized protein DUF4062 [Grimontella sp. AG753]|nr:uncharacterized protein DUF4062 [Grimontella sp. AG753]